MTEARYRGQKVVVVSPDYSDHVKFADDWLPRPARHRRRAGDGDGPRDAQGVLGRARACRASRTTPSASPTCRCWSRSSERDGAYVPGRFLTAADLGDDGEHAEWKPVRARRARPARRRSRNGSVGFRYGEEGKGRWNLRLGRPRPGPDAARPPRARRSRSTLPRFDIGDGPGGAAMRRGVPAIRVGGSARDDGARPHARHLRRRPRRPAGRLARGLRRRRAALHAGVAGGDHRRRPAHGGARSRASSRATPRSAAGAR